MGDLIQGPWPVPDAPTLDILNTARWQRVTVKTIRRWMADGMPFETIDGTPRFNPSKVLAYLREREERKAG